jgi:hypothetical protein
VSLARIAVISAVAFLVGFAACRSPDRSPSEWLAKTPEVVYFLEWTRDGNSVEGTLHAAGASCDDQRPGGCRIDTFEESFTGVVDEPTVRLTLEDGIPTEGTIADDTLRLRASAEDADPFVLRFRPSDRDAYEDAVADLRARAAAGEL